MLLCLTYDDKVFRCVFEDHSLVNVYTEVDLISRKGFVNRKLALLVV